MTTQRQRWTPRLEKTVQGSVEGAELGPYPLMCFHWD